MQQSLLRVLHVVALLCVDHSFGFTTNGTHPWPRRELVAVIVEPRRHPMLVPVIAQFASVRRHRTLRCHAEYGVIIPTDFHRARPHPLSLQVLGDDWRFHIFHGTENADLACEARRALEQPGEEVRCDDRRHHAPLVNTAAEAAVALSHDGGNGASRVALTSLGVPKLFPKDTAYNSLLASASFWAAVAAASPGAANALVFQTDTALCGPPLAPSFLRYAYVGAPWSEAARREAARAHARHVGAAAAASVGSTQTSSPPHPQSSSVPVPPLPPPPPPMLSELAVPVGNGGLSLRRVDAMLAITAAEPWDGRTPEDVWFSGHLQRMLRAAKQGGGGGGGGGGVGGVREALPAPSDSESSRGAGSASGLVEVAVGGGSVPLDSLGPIIVNSDGTTRRIANWAELDPREQAVAKKRIAARNQKRLAGLRAEQQEQQEVEAGVVLPGAGAAWGGVAPVTVAAAFAVESMLPAATLAPGALVPFFGVHAPQRFLRGGAFAALASACPAALALLPNARPSLANVSTNAATSATGTAASTVAAGGGAGGTAAAEGASLGLSAACVAAWDPAVAPWTLLPPVAVPCAAAAYDHRTDTPPLAGAAAASSRGRAGAPSDDGLRGKGASCFSRSTTNIQTCVR